MLKRIFVIDTCALYEFPGWIKKLSKALKEGELNGEKVEGEIVIPETVFENEVSEKYSKLSKKKKEHALNKDQKKLFKKVRRAKALLDKELILEKNGVWRVQRVTDGIQWAMREMGADSELSEMENSPNDNDLLIVATALSLIYYRKRLNRVTMVSWDGGILRALTHCGFSLKGGNPKDLFPSYWKRRRFMVRVGLKKEYKKYKKGDRR